MQKTFELPFAQHLETLVDTTTAEIEQTSNSAQAVALEKECAPTTTWSGYISQLVKTTESIWLQLLLVIFLGLLMSLTPCVYPMIPITIGILQSQGSKSVIKNFLLSLSYSFGISTTFALLGLIAALSGNMFGQLLINPIFVLSLVAALTYLAFSMFGCYEIYIPRFMQGGSDRFKGGSFFSAFAFGLVSGSVASPCLSPGLALLLSIVATLGSKLLGFLLLFSFGIGLSVPLMIIGTFSGSINVLPRSGMWMVEIKKLFGFMLLGLCVFYLKNIVTWYILSWLLAVGVLAAGIYYLRSIKKSDGTFWRYLKNLCSIGCIAASVFLFVKAYQTTFHPVETTCSIWLTDYEAAHKQACCENKRMFIKFGSAFCSLCTAIDNKLLKDADVVKAFDCMVTLKIDATQLDEEPYKGIKEKYNVVGFPTFLLLDPETDTLIKRWEGELYSTTKKCFIDELLG